MNKPEVKEWILVREDNNTRLPGGPYSESELKERVEEAKKLLTESSQPVNVIPKQILNG